MKKGDVLFLTICSNHKARGGFSFFDPAASILSLHPSYKKDLIKRRREVLNQIAPKLHCVLPDRDEIYAK